MRYGAATCYGAISVINAIIPKIGATIGISLRTSAKCMLREGRGEWVFLSNNNRVNSRLGLESVRRTFEYLELKSNEYSGTIEVQTNIPSGVGLKSSSSFSCAVILSLMDALGMRPRNQIDVARISALASIDSSVSITGAMDDALSCILGGFNLANNKEKRMLYHQRLKEMYVAVVIPHQASKRKILLDYNLERFGGLFEPLIELCRNKKYWTAMTLNGMIYSSLLGYDASLSKAAIEHGAIASGLSGTGPAVASVFESKEDASEFCKGQRERNNDVLIAMINNRSCTFS